MNNTTKLQSIKDLKAVKSFLKSVITLKMDYIITLVDIEIALRHCSPESLNKLTVTQISEALCRGGEFIGGIAHVVAMNAA